MSIPYRFSKSLVVFLAALIIPCSQGWGWINTGHKVVALIAWADLTPKTRDAVTEILKQHPRYEKDLLFNAPADETPQEQDRTAFATAATWPDMIRDLSNPMSQEFHHPAWHYIDLPVSFDGQAAVEKPAKGDGPQNIVEALNQCVAGLKDPSKSALDKAVDLCWVEHLVGDIHQPLHAASLFSHDFPEGDQGGNAEQVLRDSHYRNTGMKLHLLWDSLPGDFNSEELDQFEANGLRADPKFSRDTFQHQLAITGFMDWAKESHDLAEKDVYLNGELKLSAGAARGQRGTGTGTASVLPPDYVRNAEHLAMKQVTLAGYRLADLLNGIYDPK